ncbi:hypothetical protein MRB53_042364 [Persea americana]|nr:hypothetical protein MRB53_042364 [Persea americana]
MSCAVFASARFTTGNMLRMRKAPDMTNPTMTAIQRSQFEIVVNLRNSKGDIETSDTGTQAALEYPYRHSISRSEGSQAYHRSTSHIPTGIMNVYPHIKLAAIVNVLN